MTASCFCDKTLASLIAKEPLIGEYLDNSEIIETKHLPQNVCAGITIQNNKIILFINPARFNILTESDKAGVVVHEYLHVLLGHHSDRYSSNIDKIIKILNVAQDISINQLIIKSGLTLPSFAIMHNSGEYNLRPLQSSEYYYNELIKDIPKFIRHFGEIDISSNDSEVNNHSEWQKPNGDSYSIVEQIAQEYINFGHTYVGQSLSGTEYSNILKSITISNNHQINWINEIRHLLRSAISNSRIIDYKRQSRRWEDPDFILPARKKKFDKYKVALIIDVSSSMQHLLPHVMSEVNNLALFASIKVYFCDTEITKVLDNYSICQNIDIIGYGGTNLQPAFIKAEKDGAKTIICFTDGYFEGKDIRVQNTKIVWGVYNNPTFCPKAGKIVRIEV